MTTEGKLLIHSWTEFETKILDAIDAGPLQRRETRRAFYAGAAAMFDLVFEATKDEDETVCEINLTLLNDEIKEWLVKLGTREEA